MAEFEYRPDICSVCLLVIAPDGPVAIVDEGRVVPPQYYHIDCLLKSPDQVRIIHNYWRHRVSKKHED